MDPPSSPAALVELLSRAGVPLARWGRGEAKTVLDLWEELGSGEAALAGRPLRRVVRVVQIHVRRPGHELIEIAQELRDGRRRERGRPPSEKLHHGEPWLGGARRCLAEELGSHAPRVRLLEDTHRTRRTTDESPSYPGLWTRYEVHEVDAEGSGLPEGTFSTGEGGTSPGDPVVRHYWDWCPAR